MGPDAKRRIPSESMGPDAKRRIPSESSVQYDENVALADRLALFAADLSDGPGVLGFDRHLHLHRLEDDDGVVDVDLIADGYLDLPDGSGDVGGDVRHRAAE
jgi:hypothetical protein